MYKKEGREKRRKKKKSLQRVRETKRERRCRESRRESGERVCGYLHAHSQHVCVRSTEERSGGERERGAGEELR